MRRVLPFILATLTNKPRYIPEVEWSDKSWTHNVFRVYELIFGRKYGIRAEARSTSDGRYEIYTLEAFCALIETQIRRLFNRQWVEIRQPQLAGNPYGYWFPQIRFAIALDASATSTAQSASPFTWTHTCTGSNLLIAIGAGMEAGTTQPAVSAVTYNSVGATKAREDQNSSTSTAKCTSSLWLLGGPSTGANTVSVTATLGTTPHVGGGSVSYSGAQSSSVADASNGTNNANSGTYTSAADQTISVTTIVDNCWIVAVGYNQGTTGSSVVADQTQRSNLQVSATNPFGNMLIEDTNAAQTPAGSKTVGFKPAFTGSARGFCFSAASFAPGSGVVVATVQPMLTLLGVG